MEFVTTGAARPFELGAGYRIGIRLQGRRRGSGKRSGGGHPGYQGRGDGGLDPVDASEGVRITGFWVYLGDR